MSEECSYWSGAEERVLGLVFRDTQDDDYGWILLARDKIGRFRCADVNASLTTEAYATAVLRERISVAVESGDSLALGDQKDETNYPVDLLQIPGFCPAYIPRPSDRLSRHDRLPSVYVTQAGAEGPSVRTCSSRDVEYIVCQKHRRRPATAYKLGFRHMDRLMQQTPFRK